MSNLSSLVLEALLQSEATLSGERLAEELNVTRAAVWKAVLELREAGFELDGATNRGYRLKKTDLPLRPETVRMHLGPDRDSFNLIYKPSLTSTNECLKALAREGAPDGTVVFADTQTAGHGRFSRPFWSPPGTGLYFSFLLRRPVPIEQTRLLTVYAAVAAAETVDGLCRRQGKETRTEIKWVNDLYLQGKKYAGILCESSFQLETQTLDYAVIGIGINTGRVRFPAELSTLATSIGNETGSSPDRCELLAALVTRLSLFTPQLAAQSVKDYAARSYLSGKEVLVFPQGAKPDASPGYPARVLGIDEDAALLVQNEAGNTIRLTSGEISVRPVRSDKH